MGGLPQCMLGYQPTREADTPSGTGTHPLPGADNHQEQSPPPPTQCMLGDTGNKQAVRILLERIIVFSVMSFAWFLIFLTFVFTFTRCEWTLNWVYSNKISDLVIFDKQMHIFTHYLSQACQVTSLVQLAR